MSGFHAVVLAAGAGSRFGGGKLMAPFRDGWLLDHALAAALAAPVDGVVLITGADAERVGAHVGRDDRLRLIHASDHAEGMAASLRTGVAALPAEAAGVLVFLGDMPRTPPDLPARLIAAVAGGAAAAVPVFEGRRGHPAAFDRALFPDLLALRGDRGARDLLDGLGPRLVQVEVADPGVLIDVDTRADLERLG